MSRFLSGTLKVVVAFIGWRCCRDKEHGSIRATRERNGSAAGCTATWKAQTDEFKAETSRKTRATREAQTDEFKAEYLRKFLATMAARTEAQRQASQTKLEATWAARTEAERQATKTKVSGNAGCAAGYEWRPDKDSGNAGKHGLEYQRD